MHVSDYVQDAKIFWGIPTESKYVKTTTRSAWTRHRVVSKIDVLEGYGRIQNKSEITVISSADDGASCGEQLNVGVPQLIITLGEKNSISSCNCPPPTAYLLDYLKEGKDRYLPDLDDCWDSKNKDRRYKSTEKCKVWAEAPDDYSAVHQERMDMYRRKRESEKASED